jgi:hypothetical protein
LFLDINEFVWSLKVYVSIYLTLPFEYNMFLPTMVIQLFHLTFGFAALASSMQIEESIPLTKYDFFFVANNESTCQSASWGYRK